MPKTQDTIDVTGIETLICRACQASLLSEGVALLPRSFCDEAGIVDSVQQSSLSFSLSFDLLYATAIGSCESGQTHTECLLLLSERKASVLAANPSSCGIGRPVVSASREEEDRRALTDEEEEEEEEEEDGVRIDQRESCCARAQGALFSACRNQF
jgi:hypothetical protein